MTKILLVSLIHNRKHLVGPSIQSAVSQTLGKDKWTHLLVDNASTDGANKVAEVFAKKYPNIKFAQMATNIGQMPAYNYVLKTWIPKHMPDAKVMVQLDSDDLLAPSALEAVYNVYEEHPNIGMTYSNFNIIGPAPRSKLKHKSHPKAKLAPNQFTPQGQQILRKMQIKGNVIGHLRALSVEKLNDIGGFDESYRYSTDFNMACKMLEKHMVIKIEGRALYHWREHGDQVQGYSSPEQTKNWQDMQAYYRKRWQKRGLI